VVSVNSGLCWGCHCCAGWGAEGRLSHFRGGMQPCQDFTNAPIHNRIFSVPSPCCAADLLPR
jgi:hypothetical protein